MKHILFLTPLLAATPALAQDATPTPTPDAPEKTIVVTAERNPQPVTDTPSTITVITREQIEAKKAFDLPDLLRLSPGLEVVQSGTFGKQTSVFIRGTNSSHSIVLIDGMRISSSANGGFDFGTIPSDDIDHIEILRGPQSALYGSDAIGGVINIIMRRGTGPLKTGATLELGSDSTNKQSVSVRGQAGKGGLSFSATRLKSEGDFNNDDYKNLAASLRYDMPLGSTSKLAFIGRFDHTKLGIPGATQVTIDPNDRSNPSEDFAGIQFEHNGGNRHDQVSFNLSNLKLDYDNLANAIGDSTTTGTNKNKLLNLNAQTSFAMGNNTLTFGAEARRDQASIDSTTVGGFFPGTTQFSKKTHTESLFAQDEFKSGKITLAPGVRYEDNSQFGHNVSGRLAGSFQLDEDSKIKMSFGTAFQAPSFTDLYYPGFSNPNLAPVKSKGYELGYLHTWNTTGHAEVTLFRNKIRNLIQVTPDFTSVENIGHARTEGVEFEVATPIRNGLHAVFNQTFMDLNADKPLLRRPKSVTSADLIANRGKISADLGINNAGTRKDVNPVTFATSTYGGHTRFDLTLGYDVHPGLQVYGRFLNLFDQKYEEAAGYRAPGFNFVLGVRTAAF